MENFINSILNDAEGGCAGGLLFIGVIALIFVYAALKEKLSPITEPIKTRFYMLVINPIQRKIHGKIEQRKAEKEEQKIRAAYKTVSKDLRRKNNQYNNTIWNALASTYQEN